MRGKKMKQVQGTVKWFNKEKGFGFINIENEERDIFVHYSQIQIVGYKELCENDVVKFDLIEKDSGLQAINVKKIKSKSTNIQGNKKMAKQ